MSGKSSARPPIPPLIKRNTLLLAFSQGFTGAGMQTAFAFGPLVVISLMGSAGLAGLSVSVLGISRFLVAYPAGKITDRYGRKAGMFLGLSLAMVGTITIGSSIIVGSFPSFLAGLLTFGMGMSAAQQLRVAAADMYPPNRRAEGLGLVVTGALGGVIIAPAVSVLAHNASESIGLDPLSLPWLFMPVLILIGAFAISRVHPDPRDIAAHLEQYYPDYHPDPQARARPGGKMNVRIYFANPVRRVASIASFAATGNMSIVMTVTSLVLHSHGQSLPAIAVAQASHSTGMWGFSLFMGRFADRFGRKPVTLAGLVVATGGVLLVAFTSIYVAVAFGAFLVGLGWSAVNVSSTVSIADTTQPFERGQAVGLNDSFAAFATFLLPIAAGTLAQSVGLPATGVLAIALMVAPITLVALSGESRPRRQDRSGVLPSEAGAHR